MKKKSKENVSQFSENSAKLFFVFCLALLSLSVNAQVTEHFSDESTGASSFTTSGYTFNFTGGRFVIANYATYGWTGSAKDDYYADNYGNYPGAAGVLGSITTSSSTFKVTDLYVFPGETGDFVANTGSVIIRGKLSGATQFTHTIASGSINTSGLVDNGFTFANLSAYSSFSLDQLEFEVTGALRYLAIDAFKHTATATSIAPSTTTNAAGSVTSTGATLNGTVNANNASTTVTFEYGLTMGYGSSATADQSPVTGSSNTSVSKAITGLTPNTTYHYRVKGVNAGGTTTGLDQTFMTSAVAPTATTDAAGSVTSTGATLNGTVNANNASTTVTFEYGLTTGYGSSATAVQSPVTGTSSTSVSKAITGLTSNTTYHYRVVGVNTAGTTNGLDQTFTTSTVVPTVTSGAASSITGTSVTLSGTVNANNASTVVTFEYGLTTAYGSSVTADQSPVNGTSNTSVSKAITDLTPNTTYHFRVKGVNAAGTTNGLDQTFTTSAVVPTATTDAAGSVTSTGATLNGTVNANNASTTVTFEYGLTTGYGSSVTADQNPLNGTSNTSVSKAITGLTPNTTYHFRVIGVNTAGTTNGLDQTFSTKDIPNVSFTSASQSSIGESGLLTITVQLSEISSSDITVPFTINASSTSILVNDFSLTPSPITITAGNTTGTITITITTDALDENNETVIVNMGTPTNATLGAITSHTATITDDDETPVVTTSQSFTINENSTVGSVVSTVIASDTDAGTTFSGWTITANVNPDGDGNNAFAINASTGQVTVVDAGDLDREANSSLTIKVTVSDGTNTSSEESVIINLNDLNDVIPFITASQEFHVTEQSPNGTTVGTVMVTDADVTTTTFQNWTITAGNSNGYFAINSSTGVITVVDNTGLNPNINQSFTLTLTVSDGISTSSPQTVLIIVSAINDENPVITATQSFSIDENSANATSVGTILATDPDFGTVFQGWAITAGNTNNAFAINASTGQLTVNTASALDYENSSSFSLTIQVSDGLHTGSGVVTVNLNNLNDNTPVINDITYIIDENVGNGTAVGTINATDADGALNNLNFSITSGNTNAAFLINAATGAITVNKTEEINFEVTPVFNLVVSVSDGAHSDNANVTINLNNVVETGINDEIELNLKIYPNPAINAVNVSFGNTSISNYTIEIYNTNGVRVYQSESINASKTNNIDLTGYSKGIYFIKLYNQHNSFTKKLIVE